MKKTKWMWITGLVCLFFFGGVMKAKAATNEQYQTDFSQVKDWTTFPGQPAGQWQNEHGVFSVSDGRGDKALLNDRQFTNFEYNVDVQVNDSGTGGNQDAGMLFRVQDPTAGVDGYRGYYFAIDLPGQQAILGKVNGTQWTQIATKKMTLKAGKTYQLKVRASGDHIQGFVDYQRDDYPRVDVVDDQFKSGQIGVRSNAKQASFDNVAVSAYQEAKPTGPTYQNPILPEIADPDVLYHGGTYYLYGTTTGYEAGGIKVYTSTDLTNWTDKGLAMKMGPKNWGASGFWAPDLIERDGKFYMYYTANEHLNVAVSDSPLGPFEQKKVGPMHWDTKEIDAHVFKDDDGQYYLYFVRFTDGNVVWGAKLNDDMTTIDESTLTALLVPSQPWEQDMARVNEGPYMLKKDGVYYLTYSGAHFESTMYGSGFATSKSPLGPYQKYKNNPIMQSNSVVHGTGHHGITVSPDGSEMFMVYHRHFNLTQSDPRQFAIDRLRFATDEDGQTILEVAGPTVTPQPIPSGAVDADNFIEFAPLKTTEITVKQGSDPSSWNLPKFVGIRTSKSKTGVDQDAAITWNKADYDPNKTDDQELRGTVTLPAGISNLGKQELTVTMTVKTKQKEAAGQVPAKPGKDQDSNDGTGDEKPGKETEEKPDQGSQTTDSSTTQQPQGGETTNPTQNGQSNTSSPTGTGFLPQTGEFLKQNSAVLAGVVLVIAAVGSVILYRRKKA